MVQGVSLTPCRRNWGCLTDPLIIENSHKKSADRPLQSLSADGNMQQITEGSMEHDVCFFDAGNDAAWRARPSDAGAAAVCAAACMGHWQLPWYLAHTTPADGIFFVLAGLAALSWVVSLIRVAREMVV